MTTPKGKQVNIVVTDMELVVSGEESETWTDVSDYGSGDVGRALIIVPQNNVHLTHAGKK